MRRFFGKLLLKAMAKDKRIYFLVGDLGWSFFDEIKMKYANNRFINCGIAEQNMVAMAAGLASAGKIPFVFSIATFLIYRPYEFIRNDIAKDQANVKLIACGRASEYENLGFTHCCLDDSKIMQSLGIKTFFPNTKEEVERDFRKLLQTNLPCYLNLSRN